MGLETVDKGEFEVGETVKVAYVDQQHKDIETISLTTGEHTTKFFLIGSGEIETRKISTCINITSAHLAFEGDSNVFYFEGSYSEYEENKLKRLGNEEPKRVK